MEFKKSANISASRRRRILETLWARDGPICVGCSRHVVSRHWLTYTDDVKYLFQCGKAYASIACVNKLGRRYWKLVYLSRQATIDHIRPRVKGGRNTLDNLQLLCYSCNSSKQDRYVPTTVEGILRGIPRYPLDLA